MKIAVVDDSISDRKKLTSYIKSISSKLNYEIEVSAYSLGEDFLEDEDFSILDVVFLDIYMGVKDGMEVAKTLRGKGYQGLIIFCTTTPDFAIEGYCVNAIGYILKPFTYEKIEEQLKDIWKRLGENARSIRVKGGRQWHRVCISDILYIDKQGNYVTIHTYSKTYCVRSALAEMEMQLHRYNCFVKCDRGIIVNLENIEEVQDNTILLKNNSCIPVSRSNKPIVAEHYFDYIFENME